MLTEMDRAILRSALIRDEGLRLKPYKDTVGKLTIGVGRNLDDVGLSSDEAAYLLNNDITRAVQMLDEIAPWWGQLDQVRQHVLINMVFNLGYKLRQFTRTLKAINEGRYDEAADHMMDSLWARQVKGRAARLSKAMRTGIAQ